MSFLAGWVGIWHVVLVASGWTYNLALKPTAWSPLPYFVGFASLPIYVVGVSGAAAPWWMAAAGGLLGVAAHFANAAPDVEDDRAAGVRGLPQRLGARSSVVVALVLLGAVGALLLVQLDLTGWAEPWPLSAVALPLMRRFGSRRSRSSGPSGLRSGRWSPRSSTSHCSPSPHNDSGIHPPGSFLVINSWATVSPPTWGIGFPCGRPRGSTCTIADCSLPVLLRPWARRDVANLGRCRRIELPAGRRRDRAR